MRVPLLDLSAQFAPHPRPTCCARSTRVCDSQRFILGADVEALRARASPSGSASRTPIGMSSGTDALLAALMALGVGPGDEVVTPTYSFFATAGCVWRLGRAAGAGRRRSGDAQRDRRRPSRAAITPRTKAIIPVHLYGQMADMPPILAVAARHGVGR